MSAHNAQSGTFPVLYEEHLVLGASFGQNLWPLSYPAAPSSAVGSGEGTYIADVSFMQMLLFAGGPSQAFAHAAFAGDDLGIGDCAWEAVLTGDGSLASIPLLARTGDAEYVSMDLSPRADVLSAWLSFLSAVEQQGFAPYAGMETEDVTGSHVALLLWGADAASILKDYLGNSPVPARGTLRSLHMDAIPCIVAHVPLGGLDGYLLLVPLHAARTLWRSLLSFGQLEPVGTKALKEALANALPWTQRLTSGDAIRMTRGELVGDGLARRTGDFVGSRGLVDAAR